MNTELMSKQLEHLIRWGDWGRRFQERAAIPSIDWTPAARMEGFAKAILEEESRIFLARLRSSNDRLCPYIDPLSDDFTAHEAVTWDREERYSRFLAYLINIYGLAIFGDVVGTCCSGGALSCELEYRVSEGHDGHEGRIDILIMDEKVRPILAVELKVTDADSADTEKGAGYLKSLANIGMDIPRILIATEGSREVYEGDFHLVRWWDVCRNLRTSVTRSIGSMNPTVVTMTLCFLAATERSLLGLSARHPKEAGDYLSEIESLLDSGSCREG